MVCPIVLDEFGVKGEYSAGDVLVISPMPKNLKTFTVELGKTYIFNKGWRAEKKRLHKIIRGNWKQRAKHLGV